MSRLEDLSIKDSAIKRIVHNHIEKNIAPEFNRRNRTIKLIPFDIKLVQNFDTFIRVWYTVKIKSTWEPNKFEDIDKIIDIPIDEYKLENRNQKLISLGVELGGKVRKKIDGYIGFDSNELFPVNSLVRIFGGAIRDAISNREIHDVDIILGSGSLDYVENILTQNGYKYIESLTPKDLSSIYNDIRVINEPHSWVKEDKIIQLIRPAVGQIDKEIQKPEIREGIYKKTFTDLIRNVDISCCGVSYDGEKVYENYESAVSHCKNGIFIVNKKAKMYSERRITHRKVKLTSRGWIEVKPDTATYRDLKIDKILSEEILDYVPEYKDNLYYSNQYSDDDYFN